MRYAAVRSRRINYPPSRSTPTLRSGRSARLNLLLTISEHHRTSPPGHACGPSPHSSRRRLFDLSAWWSKRHVARQRPPRGKSAFRIHLDDCWRRWRLRLFGFAPELTRSALPFVLGDATLSAGRWRNCTTRRGAATMCLSSNQQDNDHFGPPPCCGVGPLAAYRRTRSAASPVLAVCKARRGQN